MELGFFVGSSVGTTRAKDGMETATPKQGKDALEHGVFLSERQGRTDAAAGSSRAEQGPPWPERPRWTSGVKP